MTPVTPNGQRRDGYAERYPRKQFLMVSFEADSGDSALGQLRLVIGKYMPHHNIKVAWCDFGDPEKEVRDVFCDTLLALESPPNRKR
jgi:hypothetical protein